MAALIPAAPTQHLAFGPFRLDLANAQLWRGTELLRLRPKTLAVLHYLAEHPGRLISKDEFFGALWPDTTVSPTVLRVCIREIRTALGETAAAPQYVETRGKQGYRFIGTVDNQQPRVQGSLPHPLSPLVVGRRDELLRLQKSYEHALAGHRQVVFVTGEAGIGKTTLVNLFLEHVTQPTTTPPSDKHPETSNAWAGLGQCVEQYGTGEAYRPVLEALGRLCRGVDGQEVIALLSQHAPTWLIRMPALLSAEQMTALQPKVTDANQERMLRELAEAVEAITVERPLVLVLEDLHWSDASTVELLAVLARRRESARLLLLGTYRPVDIVVNDHPLKSVKQELQIHNHCVEFPLEFLSEADISDYLSRRFAEPAPPASLVTLIHNRTDGNPLFLVNVVDALVTQGILAPTDNNWAIPKNIEDSLADVPDSLRAMIEQQVERLSTEEQRLLRVASVVGVEFSCAAVAAGLSLPMEQVEEACEDMARRWPFIRMEGAVDWPDGTLTSRYQFTHALYQDTLYAQLVEARQARLHRLVGERQEAGYGDHASEIAAELAVHFEQGRDLPRAVQYFQQAGQNALQRNAYQETSVQLTQALRLLHTLPESPERDEQELALSLTLGPALMTTKGYSAPEVKEVYDRALALCRQAPETPELFSALVGLWSFYLVQGTLLTARELGEHILALAQHSEDASLLLVAHYVLASTLLPFGEITACLDHAEQGRALYDLEQQHSLAMLYADEPGVQCQCLAILSLWMLGYPDQARQRSEAVLRLAQDLDHPFSVSQTLGFTAVCHHYERDLPVLLDQAERLIVLSEEHSFPFWLAAGHLLRGWVLAQQGNTPDSLVPMRQAMAASEATGAKLYRTYYLGLLAEACGAVGHVQEGLDTVAEALAHVEQYSERSHEVELYRLKGELLLQSKGESPRSHVQGQRSHVEEEAEACFRRAIEVAQQQKAKSFELRAALGLARLWRQQSKATDAHTLLSRIYDWFTEGFDTPDLQEAKALLETL